MSRVALILGVLLAVAAAAAGALIILRAPSMSLALYAIGASEKSFVVIGAALVAGILLLMGSRPGSRLVSLIGIVLAVVTIVVGLIPLAQAFRVAGDNRVSLKFGRYLGAPIEKEAKGNPKKTVTYNTVDGKALDLDVYVGSGAAGKTTRPVVIVHGGGWSSGDKGDAALFSQWLADQGHTVFDVAYRTSPQPNWKSAVGDVKCAIGWVKAHATGDADWKIDPAKVVLLGRSAGGHLALLAAYTAGDPKLPPACEAADTSVDAVVSYYGPTDLTWGYAHPANPAAYPVTEKIRNFVGGPPEGNAELYKLLSPSERVKAGAPRTLLIHGGRDQFVHKHNVELLVDKAHAVDVRVETLTIPYAQHGFDFVFGGFGEQIAEAVVLKFLRGR
jgi:acetyl esterase/lipase